MKCKHHQFDWNSDICTSCNEHYNNTLSFVDKIFDVYFKMIPYQFRPESILYSLRCRFFKKYTTIKPRKLDHGWCDRSHLILHMVFEIACQFIEEEGPKNQKKWEWHKEHNPSFYKSWIETKEICDWWLNEYDEKEFDRDITSEGYQKIVRDKAKRIIELSPWYWT